MFGFGKITARKAREYQQIIHALDKSAAVIEFSVDGRILQANENFLKVMGYQADEIIGRHHSMFVSESYRESAEYKTFWRNLAQGEFQTAEFQRVAKGGKNVWIEASYNPVFDNKGNPVKVIKFAYDVTAKREQRAEQQSILNAIQKSQAVIEFNLDGTVISANDNFLAVMGYRADEIIGRHHSMFVTADEKNSEAYRAFWRSLNEGEFAAAQFHRVAKGGRSVWIEASYNPVFNASGNVYKVVKFATDITQQVNLLVELKSMIDNNFSSIEAAILELQKTAQQAVETSGNTVSNVQTVTAGTEEMSVSISEISRNMLESQSTTERMVRETVSADESTQRMAQVVEAMTGIVEVIQNIAGQINLLALNATIESARAGEAGKGFAVVANEVKNLANQAARATGQISDEIQGIQEITAEVVGALRTIRTSVETVRDAVGVTSDALGHQTSITSGVSEHMRNMNFAVESFSRNIDDIRQTVENVSQSVMKTRSAAEVLAR
ncbi:PAS domain-containing methyl-accepting chemotaxis protein [Thalassospira sp. MCCC 1A01428]|uniref:methyl-accepting chemotaxis protein n=1 Tax=Thalassospira sp. MCCC 1A01428 TaxID=1470575 RepID=UPI000A1FB638|nr:PAS domain-containing methyl-accepting chemotaxis protein [Thalassospira sp. MCCC 1A01428]OSQ45149.1 chemotaxis protein [Thalassospira sp. MCCC 1A01428]